MTDSEKKELMKLACKVRMGIIEGTHSAKSGHPGGSLSAADMYTYLYFKEMNVDPEKPDDPDRDRFVLSKGHTAPGLYSGQGVSAAAGMALAAKKQGKDLRVYTLLGDGEIEEGQVWEAMMFAHHYELDNLCVIVDNNDLQIDGRIADVIDPYPIPDKFKAFGLHVEEIDGHDFNQIEAALKAARETKGVPTAIIMKTLKGKGVSFMEDQAGWHGKAPNDEQYDQAMAELGKQLEEVEAM